MDVHFGCTMCGKCCHNLKLPLSIDEAILWLEQDGDIQILCEAIPWPEELPPDNLPAHHKRARSFAASSGSLPTRIIVLVVAAFDGACPHLLPDMRCGNYDLRPRVCRIYPAEINRFVELVPSGKACPPDAWTVDKPLMMKGLRLVDTETQNLVDSARARDMEDVPRKATLCIDLGINTAALANEGFAVYSPSREVAYAALKRALERPAETGSDLPAWTFVSNRRATIDTLKSAGAQVVPDAPGRTFTYLGFLPDQ